MRLKYLFSVHPLQLRGRELPFSKNLRLRRGPFRWQAQRRTQNLEQVNKSQKGSSINDVLPLGWVGEQVNHERARP